LNGEFISALLRDFRHGGPKAIERVRRTQPAAYLKIRSPRPPSGNVMDEIEPNPRGITRSEVEQAVAEWCQAHMDAPLCKKLERDR
jgi:hypothetical protein